MQENLNALSKKAEISVITADTLNTKYMAFQRSRVYAALNHGYAYLLIKLFHLLFFLAVYLEIKTRIRKQHCELFIVRFSFPNYLIVRYLSSKGSKILLELHGFSHVELKEYGQSYLPPFYISIIRYLERKMLYLSDEIITVSGSLRESVAAFGINKGRIHVIHNAIDPDVFDAAVNPGNIVRQYNIQGQIVIGFVGSFARYHGVHILLDVAESLKNKYDVHFLMIGRNVHGPDNFAEEVRNSHLSGMFTFTGEVPHATIPLYIAAMDIAVIPDFNTYGSPMKLFEYMAMGKAIVAPDVPPIREVLEHGRTGILFPKGDVSQALEAIDKLIEDEELRNECGRRAYRKVMREHTWDQNAEEVVKIAEQMI
jgi:glycosyltransferase involved in cell wall biosynthesis